MSEGSKNCQKMGDENSKSAQDQGSLSSFSWRMLLGTIRRTFPRAKQMKTKTLNEFLADGGKGKTLLLLDIREIEEHEISTLEGSIHVKPDESEIAKIIEKVSQIRSDVPHHAINIVCYCSVGYRSSKFAQLIQDKVNTDIKDNLNVSVYNLEGSIFKWANERRPMVDKYGNETVFCHPYSTIWGKFLNENLRKWTL